MYLVKTPYSKRMIHLLKGIPGRRWYEPDYKGWVCDISALSTNYLKTWFPEAEWGGEAKRTLDVLSPVASNDSAPLPKIDDYIFKTKPFDHQLRIFAETRDRPVHALLMEQRTGKTKIVIDNAAYLYERGKIDGVLIVTLNSVTDTWKEEFEIHWPDRLPITVEVFDADKPKKHVAFIRKVRDAEDDELGLPVYIVNVEGLSHERIYDLVCEFVSYCRSLFMAVDESTAIANPTAERSRSVCALRDESAYRRILSGTPIKQNPFDLYGQFLFLDPKILGFGSLYRFKRYFAEWEGYEILEWRHLEQLQSSLEGYYSRVLRKDVFKDLPEVTRRTYTVQLTPEQRRIYDELNKRLVSEVSGKKISADLVITKYLRLSQIVGGFVTLDEEKKPIKIKGRNPKLDELMRIVSEEPGKIIVWARFKAELNLIAKSLRKQYGDDTTVEFHGDVNKKQRVEARKKFQDPKSPVRFFVGQMETGGIGIDLDATNTMIYFSNSYKYEAREQSEARPMSSRQKRSVGIYDIVCKTTVDELVIEALRKKKDLAQLIDKKRIDQWIAGSLF